MLNWWTSDGDSDFPGIVGAIRQVGHGRTLALKGAAVVMTETNDPDTICKSGGFIDMSGPAADYCLYSKLFLLVIEAKAVPSVHRDDPQVLDDAVRVAGLRLAAYLARKCMDAAPDRTKTYELGEVDPSPFVAVTFILFFGFMFFLRLVFATLQASSPLWDDLLVVPEILMFTCE